MSTWIIGDVHGYAATLERLLTEIAFNPARDTLHFVGDLINRGPNNIDVLKIVENYGSSATTILGNHEIHLLGVAAGHRDVHHKDTISQLLESPARDRWLAWLADQPLAREISSEAGQRGLIVHAGLHPSRGWVEWLGRADRLSAALSDRRLREGLYSAGPASYHLDTASGELEQLRWDLAVLTRMRALDTRGALDLSFKASLNELPLGLLPWYKLLEADATRPHLFCGHWAAHGFADLSTVTMLDSGCAWGRSLSAYCFETREVVSTPTIETQ